MSNHNKVRSWMSDNLYMRFNLDGQRKVYRDPPEVQKRLAKQRSKIDRMNEEKILQADIAEVWE